MRYVFRLMAVALFGVAAAGPADAEKRVALVIGNAGYRAVAELPNPRKDARDVAAALEAAQFAEVVEHYDLGVREMQRALARFEDKATGADWAVVYYAGHGIEVDGRNYLVPIDAELKRATDVEDETLALDRVLARVAAAGKLQLVILDACRENPFKRRMAGLATRAIGDRGLARIEPTHANVIVAYAARDGQVALDGRPGENSPYARALLKYLSEPGLELGKFFRRVRDDVLATTGGRQRPFEYGSLTGQDLFFWQGAAAGPKPAAISPLPQPSAAATEWARVDKSSVAELETFERRHPASAEAEYARARLKELRKVAIVTPLPPPVVAPPKVVEPAVGVFTPGPGVTPLTPERERALKPGDTFKECDVCPEMVVVPAGTFTMGSPVNEKGRQADESPQHRVTIARPFAVGKYEVTSSEWKACADAGWCIYRGPAYAWNGGRRPMDPSWDGITKQYLPWLSRKTGKAYRLLSEAEWEYAARAGTTTPFSTGRTITTKQAVFSGSTVEVGSFPTNRFGLHDMHGNLQEWVEDCWNDNYNGAPTDGSAWMAGDCSYRVYRGGGWYNDRQGLRSASRGWGLPAQPANAGFRVARTLMP